MEQLLIKMWKDVYNQYRHEGKTFDKSRIFRKSAIEKQDIWRNLIFIGYPFIESSKKVSQHSIV